MNMRRFLFYFFMFFCVLCCFSADAKQYSSAEIQRYVNQTPREAENKLSSLTAYLTAPFDNDYDKAKAIAFWIASRINYDEYLYSNGKTSRLIKRYDGQTPQELLNSRVGICSDFANLFYNLCRRAKIRAGVVHGYAYPSGHSLTTSLRRNSAHAWNYFTYKNNKIYVDTTFMAQGTTGIRGSQNNLNRQRALKDIQRQNKKISKINNFDDYYFDFNYKDEKSRKKYIHKEK